MIINMQLEGLIKTTEISRQKAFLKGKKIYSIIIHGFGSKYDGKRPLILLMERKCTSLKMFHLVIFFSFHIISLIRS